jgi:hypothetical protein
MGESNTQKALRALLSPAAELEAAMQAVLRGRNVETAIGVQLTLIGKLVGRTGRDPDDEIERRLVRAQIAANKSDGLVEDKIAVATMVLDDPAARIVIDMVGAAATILRVEDVAVSEVVAAVLVQLVIKAASGGVRQIVEWSGADPATVGRWTTQGTWGTAVWARGVDKEI